MDIVANVVSIPIVSIPGSTALQQVKHPGFTRLWLENTHRILTEVKPRVIK